MRNLCTNAADHIELLANAKRLFIDVDFLSQYAANRSREFSNAEEYLYFMHWDYDRDPRFIADSTLNRSAYQDFLSLAYADSNRMEDFNKWLRQRDRLREKAQRRMKERMWWALVAARPYIDKYYYPRRKNATLNGLHGQWRDRNNVAKEMAALHKLLVSKEPDELALFRKLAATSLDLPYELYYAAKVSVLTKYDPVLLEALSTVRKRFDRSDWTRPVWANEPWYKGSVYYLMHSAHVSVNDSGLVAYHQNLDKFKRDVQTPIKPGKYLTKFFSDVLTSEDIRTWSERQTTASKPVELQFVGTDDPDGWEWVYENAPNSCMRYNRSSRYIDSGLEGEYHPVRAYASGANDLALAFIMQPGAVADRSRFADCDEYTVAARTIVNQQEKTWLRIYSYDDRYRTKIEDLLRAAGYRQSSHTLRGQKLALMQYEGMTICPYLDGSYTSVEEDGRYLVVGEHGHDGQNSSGVLKSGCECCECGNHFHEDDVSYIESADGYVCNRCLDDNYVYAYGRNYQEWVRDSDAVYCESDSEYYQTYYIDRHDVVETTDGTYWKLEDVADTREGWVHIDDAVALDYEDGEYQYAVSGDARELPDGKFCHEDDYDDIIAEHYSDEEDEEEAETAVEAPPPANIEAVELRV